MVLFLWRYVVPDPLNYTESPPFFRCEKIIDDACSVIWCERYQEPGEIALVLRATPELLLFFWQSEIMITRDDTDRVMFVENVALTTSAENGDYIRITGVSAEGLTKRRVIGQRGAVTDMDATAAIRYYMQENIGAYWYFHTDDEHQHGRNNPYCRMYVNLLAEGEDDERITEKISAEPFGKNLCDFITEICKGNEFGYAITFDGEKLLYRSYLGDDRTLNQSERNAVIFSEEFLNLGNSEYEYSRSEYYSHVIAGGSGTGSTREYGESFTQFRSARGCGLNLRQKFINASGTSGNMLRIAAQNEVLSARETVNFTADALETGQFKYREDYFLGDRVSIVNKYGISGTATIAEVVETEDENGRYCIPTLGQFDALEYITPVKPEKPDPPPPPPPEWDKFEAEHTDAVVIVRLDADGNETSDIYYATATPPGASPQLTAWGRAVRRLYDMYEFDSSARFNVYYGNGVPYSEKIWRDYLTQYIDPNYGENHNNINMIRLPKVSGGELCAFNKANGSTEGFTRLKKVIMPESTDPDGYIIPMHFLTRSAVDEIVFRTDRIKCIRAAAFYRCESLREIELPTVVGYRSESYLPTEYIQGYAFNGCYDITITLNNSESSIEGAPWRATGATVIWKG